MQFFNKMFVKVSHPIRGIAFAIRTDESFRLDILLGVLLVIFATLVWPLSQKELLFLFLSWILLLVTELQNTALETALNRLHPNEHDDIGRSKDVSAASVAVALVFVAAVVLIICANRLLEFPYY